MPSPSLALKLAGHRGGASGHGSFVPEHSKLAYSLGASNGATWLEPDVVSSEDHVLFVMHGNELGRTSDVADKEEFAGRRTTKFVDDGDGCTPSPVTGWFAEDFTWAEISELRLRSVAGGGPEDGIYSFLRFEEMLDYVAALSDALGREIGVYPETKLSRYFSGLGLPLEEKLVSSLASRGYCGYDAGSGRCLASLASSPPGPALLQSFSPTSLRELGELTDLPRVSLVNSGLVGLQKMEAGAVAATPEYADIICLPTSFDGGWDAELFADAVKDSKEEGLTVHAWYTDDDPTLYLRLVELGVEGAFTNNAAFGNGVLAGVETGTSLGFGGGGGISSGGGGGGGGGGLIGDSPANYVGVIAAILGAAFGVLLVLAVAGGVRARSGSGSNKGRGLREVREAKNAWVLRLDGTSIDEDDDDEVEGGEVVVPGMPRVRVDHV